ncbi:MAG: DEAD/DEAH box helicase [Chlamydiales bacterium]|jgi:SNF2 family DNA or RNA helicase|nr:DEAD/DEAH box helicase [Chlamydiales bacterium]
MPEFSFSQKNLIKAKQLLLEQSVKNILFSEATYQIEVFDQEQAHSFSPFLHVDDQGKMLDGFCSCDEAEEIPSCAHLAAAYLTIFNGNLQPLHVRFRQSFWNCLCQIFCNRHGYATSVLRKKEKAYEIKSSTNKLLFYIEALTAETKKYLHALFFEQAIETEETSLKFSNLAPDELQLWKEGNPSCRLKYELCFWSDLAKWLMLLQEGKKPYTMTFEEKENRLPDWLTIQFTGLLKIECYLSEVHWPQFIPVLKTVDSPFTVHGQPYSHIRAIHYHEVDKKLFIEMDPSQREQQEEKTKGISVGDFIFIPKKGFFPAAMDPIFEQREISAQKIGKVFFKHAPILQRFLNKPIHTGNHRIQYDLFFDIEERLHIECYLFEKKDLQKKSSARFGNWVYLEKKGFFQVEDWLFDGITKIVEKADVSEFVSQHRAWLNHFPLFQTHVYTLESQLSFFVTASKQLRFEAAIEMLEAEDKMSDFGAWIYVKGQGFFAKRTQLQTGSIYSGLTIEKDRIAEFIQVHREELENMKGFFSPICPILKSGYEIRLKNEHIFVQSVMQFLPDYQDKNVYIFDEFTYVENQGFHEIAFEQRLKKKYVPNAFISKEQEADFIFYDLDTLVDQILVLQKELTKPHSLQIEIRNLEHIKKKTHVQWRMRLVLISELGEVDVKEIWQAIMENCPYLFTPAGLIILKQSRFHWLKAIRKQQWDTKSFLTCTTLDWLRLTVFEEIKAPEGESTQALQTRKWLESISQLETQTPIDLTGFQSRLRAYQETGVHWLWFLYTYGISGILCDEMGLGKTHQAMGLIVAVFNDLQKRAKFLVVCPTSVLYHWEELLKKFLPKIRVLTFYGTGRNFDLFITQADLLLTSYGVLRSEKILLSQYTFDLIVFDEVQNAKNSQSQTHKALKILNAHMRLGLTGTPIENSLLELRSLFEVIVPGYLPQEAHFKHLFVNPIEKGRDLAKKMLLKRLVDPFILRRKKKEVLLELPEKIEEISYCDLSEEQKDLYKEVFFQRKNQLIQQIEDEKKPLPYLHVFALLSTLKQICDHPCLINKRFDEFHKHRSGKWDLFVQLLQETRDSGQKLVVFSQYLNMLNLIEKYLKEQNIGFAGIRGSTRNRREMLDRFKQDPACEIFVASLQAAGVGVDLVSASVVIHYDRWWNAARENQATDRVHRMGQNRGVQVFKLVTKNTIEEHIHKLIEKKQALMEEVIEFTDQDQIKKLNREELMHLIHLIDQDVKKI